MTEEINVSIEAVLLSRSGTERKYTYMLVSIGPRFAKYMLLSAGIWLFSCTLNNNFHLLVMVLCAL